MPYRVSKRVGSPGIDLLKCEYFSAFKAVQEPGEGSNLAHWNEHAVNVGFKKPFQLSQFPLLVFHATEEKLTPANPDFPEYLVRYVMADSSFEDMLCRDFDEYIHLLRHLEPVILGQAGPGIAMAVGSFMEWMARQNARQAVDRIMVP